MTRSLTESIFLESDGPERTRRWGEALGASLRAGDLVALEGPLGAGKTMLVKGIAAGARVADPRCVTSPTFVLVNEYEGPLRIYHLDAYRLATEREFEALGVDEFLADGAVLVEWADRVRQVLPADRLEVRMEPTGPESRRLQFTARGSRARSLLAAAAFH